MIGVRSCFFENLERKTAKTDNNCSYEGSYNVYGIGGCHVRWFLPSNFAANRPNFYPSEPEDRGSVPRPPNKKTQDLVAVARVRDK